MLQARWELILDIVQNIALIGILAYLLTRVAVFQRTLTYSKYRIYDKVKLGIVFGLFSAMGNWIGIPVEGAIANSRIVGPIAGGLLGGPVVGVIAGFIGAVARYYMGGFTVWASVLSNIIVGYLSGVVYEKYGAQRVNVKTALFTAVVCEGILKFMILTMSKPFEAALKLEQVIGVPTLVANSLAVVFFVYIVRDVFSEQQRMQALSVQQAIRMIQKTSGFLKTGLNACSALNVSQIIYNETKAAAVAITDNEEVLAFVGKGDDHHFAGTPIVTAATKRALQERQTVITDDRDSIGCPYAQCPLFAVIDAPLFVGEDLVGTIKLYKTKNELIMPQEAELIQGIADFLSLQLAHQRLAHQQILLLQTEYNMLKAQVNPHFFFNSLTTVQALITTDAPGAINLINDLALFFRKTLKRGAEIVTLSEEMEAVNIYVRIEQARFHEKVRFCVSIPEDMTTFSVPVFSLQPLIENAIRHGVSMTKGGGEVRITTWHEKDKAFIMVQDEGLGISESRLREIMEQKLVQSEGAGIGINNIHRRMQKLYGKDYGLSINSRLGEGTAVILNFPWKEE
jgi:two-component system, LytTR family, sensor histidine kinase LytS